MTTEAEAMRAVAPLLARALARLAAKAEQTSVDDRPSEDPRPDLREAS